MVFRSIFLEKQRVMEEEQHIILSAVNLASITRFRHVRGSCLLKQVPIWSQVDVLNTIFTPFSLRLSRPCKKQTWVLHICPIEMLPIETTILFETQALFFCGKLSGRWSVCHAGSVHVRKTSVPPSSKAPHDPVGSTLFRRVAARWG